MFDDDIRLEVYDAAGEMEDLVMVDMNLIVRAATQSLELEDGLAFILTLIGLMEDEEVSDQVTMVQEL